MRDDPPEEMSVEEYLKLTEKKQPKKKTKKPRKPADPPVYCVKCGKRITFDHSWVIVGGESGPHQATAKARPMNMAWARKIRDQCVLAGVPFWFKQDFDTQPGQRPYIVEEDGTHTEWFQRPDHIVTIKPEKKPEQLSLL